MRQTQTLAGLFAAQEYVLVHGTCIQQYVGGIFIMTGVLMIDIHSAFVFRKNRIPKTVSYFLIEQLLAVVFTHIVFCSG